jgi:UDP-N-acetylmuramate dehydrogenase
MTDIQDCLIPNLDLSHRNTLALRASTRWGIEITDIEMLPELFAHAAATEQAVRVLGGGSNVVLAPSFDGITAIIGLKGRQLVEETSEHVVVEAAAGENWHDFVAFTVGLGFGGLENLAGIPGTTGAAPVQNIGAYGSELADTFLELTVWDRQTATTRTFSKDECHFAYRHSVFKEEPNRYVVLSIRLALPKAWRANLGFSGLTDLVETPLVTPAIVMERVVALRNAKLPDYRTEPNAGSFFQNPIISPADAAPVLAEFPTAPNFPQSDGRTKLSAGWLIEKTGLKGFKLGPVGISERHALVVVNHAHGDQSDIAKLADHVKTEVKARFGIQLHAEPIFT